MANEQQLINLLSEHQKAWTPTELCNALGLHVIEVMLLIEKSRSRGFDVRVVSGDQSGNTGKVFLGGEHV